LRWLRGTTDATSLRARVEATGGHVTLFRHGDKAAGVFHPLQPVLARIHRNLKAAFDPENILNPGRMDNF
jgi:glycolate oxidase FAD binding subunit